jgi:hypothetical protein
MMSFCSEAPLYPISWRFSDLQLSRALLRFIVTGQAKAEGTLKQDECVPIDVTLRPHDTLLQADDRRENTSQADKFL